MALLIKYWRPLAVVITLLLIWLHGNHTGAEKANGKWEYRYAILQKAAAEERTAHSERLRNRERQLVNDFATAANENLEQTNETLAKRDRIIADLRSGRLSWPGVCAAAEARPAATDTRQPPTGAEGGQSGLVAEEITARFALCDEVTHERNQAVSLLRAERD